MNGHDGTIPMTGGWTPGEVATVVIEGLVVIGSALSAIVYVGYHKRQHEEEERYAKETRKKIDDLWIQHDKRTEHCPIDVVESRVKDDHETMVEMKRKVDDMAPKIDRILGYLSAQGKGPNGV